jgi:hypothetical protein
MAEVAVLCLASSVVGVLGQRAAGVLGSVDGQPRRLRRTLQLGSLTMKAITSSTACQGSPLRPRARLKGTAELGHLAGGKDVGVAGDDLVLLVARGQIVQAVHHGLAPPRALGDGQCFRARPRCCVRCLQLPPIC